VVGADHRHDIGRLTVQDLVGLAGPVAVLDACERPWLAAAPRRRQCVVLAVLGPAEREAVLSRPPGYSVVAVLSMTDSGVIAARCGGSVAPTNSWLMPP
jgi:hypothetical protein